MKSLQEDGNESLPPNEDNKKTETKKSLQETIVQDQSKKQRKSVSWNLSEEKVDQKGGSISISISMDTSGSVSLTPVPPTTPSLGRRISKKKTMDGTGTVSSQSNKKQKVSGNLQEKDVENLNDVTSCSGVDLRKEEEELFSASKSGSRASDATRKLVQEEENEVIFERVPFRERLEKILPKYGITNVSEDFERCLSLSLEERLQGLIRSLVKVSKTRVADSERSRHSTIVTSDIRHQISLVNRMSEKDLEEKQIGEVEKGGAITKAGENTTAKTNTKEEGEKGMRTSANIKALSKWQDMAAKARQKRESGDSMYVGKASEPCSIPDKVSRENLDGLSGQKRKVGMNPGVTPVKEIERSISVKDVIAVLESDPEMTKSTFLYCLYERMHSDNGRKLE